MEGSGAGRGSTGEGVKSGKKVVVKKRKKKHIGMNCDKTCPTCRVPCDNPFFPTYKK